MNNVNKAILLINTAFDRKLYGTIPYITHLMLVARHFTEEDEIVVALLHDIVEDTAVTVENIRQAFGDVVAEAVDAITKRPHEWYLSEYLDRVLANPIALKVKIADLQENIHSGTYWFPGYEERIEGRYKPALEILVERRVEEMQSLFVREDSRDNNRKDL